MAGGQKGGRRGPMPALAVCAAGLLCCWAGLARVDRQIRSVTIYQSPPLWELRAEGDTLTCTLLGKSLQVDTAPARQLAEELRLVWETPPAPVRAGEILLALLTEQ